MASNDQNGQKGDRPILFSRLQSASSFGSCDPIPAAEVAIDTSSPPTPIPTGTKTPKILERKMISSENEPYLTTRNNKPQRSTPKKHPETSLLGLPLELQQHILAAVFEHVIAQDVAYTLELSDNMDRIPYVFRELIFEFAYGMRIVCRHRHECINRVLTPHILKLATIVAAVHSEVADAMGYVLKKALGAVHEELNTQHGRAGGWYDSLPSGN